MFKSYFFVPVFLTLLGGLAWAAKSIQPNYGRTVASAHEGTGLVIVPVIEANGTDESKEEKMSKNRGLKTSSLVIEPISAE